MLDVAVGIGLVARAVADLLGWDGHVIGIDLSMEMLAEAR